LGADRFCNAIYCAHNVTMWRVRVTSAPVETKTFRVNFQVISR